MKVIFSIDNVSNLHQLSKFLRHMDTQRATGKLKDEFQTCIGYWEGILENSFICGKEDFLTYVDAHGWCDNQTAIILMDDEGECYIKYGPHNAEYLGVFTNVSEPEAKVSQGWTYDMKTNSYWVIK
jgi:hypothetical protein